MLLYVFFALSLVLSAVLVVIHPSFLFLFLPLCFLFLVGFCVLGITFLFLCSLFCYGHAPLEKDHPFCRTLTRMTIDCILTLFRFSLRGEGLDKIPQEPCVIVSNHLSRFDPMALFFLLRGRKLGFISKKENMRIPIVGPITGKIGFLPLDRENPLRALRTMHAGARLIRDLGFTMGIYPEGTRSRDGKLLDFKPGAFVMAKRAGSPIAVTRIRGIDGYKTNLPFRKTPVTVEVLAVIEKDEVASKKPEELAEKCRRIIENGI